MGKKKLEGAEAGSRKSEGGSQKPRGGGVEYGVWSMEYEI